MSASPGITAYMDAEYSAFGAVAAGSAYWDYSRGGAYAVLAADGSEKAIETIEVGERVLGLDGGTDEVIGFGRPTLDGRQLHALNDSGFFVTADHPFLTTGGLKALDPETTNLARPALKVGRLEVGDVLLTVNGPVELRSIRSQDAPADTVVYNLHLLSGNICVAAGFLVHNYGPPPGIEAGS